MSEISFDEGLDSLLESHAAPVVELDHAEIVVEVQKAAKAKGLAGKPPGRVPTGST